MILHERNRAVNDLARSIVIVLIVETVNALRMIHQGERDVFREGFTHEAVDRIVHRWNFIASGAGDEHRGNLSWIRL
jgi:hypothetical protein